MDNFATKTLRRMSATFGTLADTLHIPDSMRCCGVGAIEAQIAAGYDDDGSTSDDSVFAMSKGGGQGNIDNSSRPSAQRNPLAGQTSKKEEKRAQEGKSVGGLRGMLSSARSLGWGKRKGGGGDDDESQISQVSGLSFLSGGLKMLASTSKTIFNSLRAPSPQLMDECTSEASSDLTSLCETGSSDREEPARGFLLWRHVRMVVRGVRGMQGVLGESSRLERTVTYRAARRVQGAFRRKLACKAVVERRSAALAALKRAEELRRLRRRREADARKRYKEACRAEGKRVLDWAVKVFLQPRAVVDLQRVWRGYRARKQLAAYLKWLEDKARRRREYRRYLAALAATRGAGGRCSEQVKRRVWGRAEFAHTGWRPRYEVENPPNMHDHVWTPPQGSESGVRTLKVLLPPPSEPDRATLVEDKNAWAGVPVGIAKRQPPPERLGPPPRPGTITSADRDGRNMPASVVGGDSDRGFSTKYNWIPAPLVGKAPLLQTQTPSTAGR